MRCPEGSACFLCSRVVRLEDDHLINSQVRKNIPMIICWIDGRSNQEGLKGESLARIVFDGFAMQAMARKAPRVAQRERLIRVRSSDTAPKLE